MAAFLSSYRDKAAFRPERFNPVVLAAGENMKVVLTCLQPGQFIPAHRPGVDMALLVLEGQGWIVAADREERVEPGALVFVPAGETRGVKAETRLVALHVVSPPPTEQDHAEMARRFQDGSWK